MADIAFLLLIFFLVTTTIDVDKGIGVALPPWNPDTNPPPIPSKNILSVKVNAANQLLVEGELMDVRQLRLTTKDFILNPNQDTNKPNKPTKAVVSLQNDRGTNYNTYLEVYNEIKAAYNELWDEKALSDYGKAYHTLSKQAKKQIRAIIPLVISEAEPTDYLQ